MCLNFNWRGGLSTLKFQRGALFVNLDTNLLYEVSVIYMKPACASQIVSHILRIWRLMTFFFVSYNEATILLFFCAIHDVQLISSYSCDAIFVFWNETDTINVAYLFSPNIVRNVSSQSGKLMFRSVKFKWTVWTLILFYFGYRLFDLISIVFPKNRTLFWMERK